MAKTKAEIQREYSKRTNYASQTKYKKTHVKRVPFDITHDFYATIKGTYRKNK